MGTMVPRRTGDVTGAVPTITSTPPHSAWVPGDIARVHNGSVLDGRLAGYWSDNDLYQGAMESADVAFRPGGTGWTYWSRSGGPFTVMRFSWSTTVAGQLTLNLRDVQSGTWVLRDRAVRHRVNSQEPCDDQIEVAYEVKAGRNVSGNPVTLLQFERRLRVGTIGDRFALLRDLTDAELVP